MNYSFFCCIDFVDKIIENKDTIPVNEFEKCLAFFVNKIILQLKDPDDSLVKELKDDKKIKNIEKWKKDNIEQMLSKYLDIQKQYLSNSVYKENKSTSFSDITDIGLRINSVKSIHYDKTLTSYYLRELGQKFHFMLVNKLVKEYIDKYGKDYDLTQKTFRIYEDKLKDFWNGDYKKEEIDYLETLPDIKNVDKDLLYKLTYINSPYFSRKPQNPKDCLVFNKGIEPDETYEDDSLENLLKTVGVEVNPKKEERIENIKKKYYDEIVNHCKENFKPAALTEAISISIEIYKKYIEISIIKNENEDKAFVNFKRNSLK